LFSTEALLTEDSLPTREPSLDLEEEEGRLGVDTKTKAEPSGDEASSSTTKRRIFADKSRSTEESKNQRKQYSSGSLGRRNQDVSSSSRGGSIDNGKTSCIPLANNTKQSTKQASQEALHSSWSEGLSLEGREVEGREQDLALHPREPLNPSLRSFDHQGKTRRTG